MKIYGYRDLQERTGDLLMLYGEPGVGKSVTSVQTADLPMLYIMTEPRDVKKFVIAADREGIEDKIGFVFYDTWDELVGFVANQENWVDAHGQVKYKTCVVDSISHLIAINLSDEILEESFESMAGKKGADDKPLTMRAKMSQEGYGTLGNQMLRFTNAIAKLSRLGMTVVCLARTENNPKYNRAYTTAPALKGQEYAKHFAGFFDFIGLVEQRSDREGRIVYPPAVSFESDGSFMAKWTGKMPGSGVANKVLNINKILAVAHGTANGKKKEKGGEENE